MRRDTQLAGAGSVLRRCESEFVGGGPGQVYSLVMDNRGVALILSCLVGVASTTGCALLAEEYARYPSPDGDRTLIVRTWADWIDPMYPLQLKHGWFTTDLGCVNGDYSGINSVEWLDNATLHIDLSDGGAGDIPVVLRFDGELTISGDPDDLLHSC